MYRAKRTIFTVQFETEEEFHGLVVKVKSIDFGLLLKLEEQAALAEKSNGDLALMRELIDTFIDNLIEWNLGNEEGEPTPQTYDGLVSHEPNLVITLVLAWFHGMVSIRKGESLGKGSTSGNSFPEASIPMTAVS